MYTPCCYAGLCMPAKRGPTILHDQAAVKPLPPSILAALAAFRAALSRYSDATRHCLAEEGVSPRQFTLLAVLSQAPSGQLSVGEVAAALHLNHNSAVGLTQRAERAGLIERVPDSSDARRVLIRLSERGTDLLHQLARAHITGLCEERGQLVTSLQRWTQELEATEDP